MGFRPLYVMMGPSALVTGMSDVGLIGQWDGGPIRLNRYVSGEESYGGADTADGFLRQIAKMTSRHGSTIGERPTSRTRQWANIGKGQAYPLDFIKVWNWCYDNIEEIKPLKVQLYNFRSNGHGGAKKSKDGVPVEMGMFFTTKSRFAQGMQDYIGRHGFGWDCIGFVQQYLLAAGFYTSYPGLLPSEFIGGRSGFTNVTRLSDVGPLNVIVYPGHVQIIDRVQSVSDNKITVTISQSSGWAARSGPMTNSDITISGPLEMDVEDKNKHVTTQHLFRILGPSPVTGFARIGRSERLVPTYPNAFPPLGGDNPDFVPGVYF